MLCILIFFCLLGLLTCGVNRLMVNVFTYCCCHWLLKIIIDWRQGLNIIKKIKININSRLQNDEELAEVIGERINELNPEELGDVSNMNEKELTEYKLRIRTMREKEFQYHLCIKRDQIVGYDKQRQSLVTLADRMNNTIH